MRPRDEVRKRLSEVRTEIRKLVRKENRGTLTVEGYEVLDQLTGARDELIWVLEL